MTKKSWAVCISVSLLSPIAMLHMLLVVLALKAMMLFFYLWSLAAPPWQGFEETRTDFMENKEQILLVRDYLVASDYETISISPAREFREIPTRGHRHHISDPKARRAAIYLHRVGYRDITKTANVVKFSRWIGFNAGFGVVYSIDRRIPDEAAITFLTHIEPLSVEGWYYFEDDFNEWRRRNR